MGIFGTRLGRTSILLRVDKGYEDFFLRFIHKSVHAVRNSEIGSNAAIEADAVIEGSTIVNSIVFGEAQVSNSTLDNSVVGHHAEVRGFSGTLNIGDHAEAG